ncbi:branched-chain amino acid ABC transporter ATPase [Clostridiales bacterium PH28_bin88]|nr:branched-chain amino acid ABC transporter ATPase [Clostridiales bacterium PH28_bin88]
MLSVNAIDVSYGYAQILHSVCLEAKKGQFVFVVGRNGAGKTTLMKTICGLLKCNSGSIVFEGQEIQGMKTETLALKGIRFIAQDKKVFNWLTVRENLELASYASRVNLAEAIRMATGTYPRFKDLLDTKAGRLSGGQKEILLILRALIGSPKLLLIDEPTEGLASIVIDDVYKLLKRMKGDVSAIIVEQNLNLVSQLADCVYLMKEGKIVKQITDQEEISNAKGLEEYL